MRNRTLTKFRTIEHSSSMLAHEKTGMHERLQGTLSDYAHHMGVTTRQRVRLIAKGVISELRQTAKEGGLMAGRAASRVKARLAHSAARRLVKLADRLEGKASRSK